MTSIGDPQVPIVFAGNECEKDEEQARSQSVKGFDVFWLRKSLMHSESETKRHFGEDVPLRRQDLIFCLNELLKLQVGCHSCSEFTGQVVNFLGQRSGIYNVQREVTVFGHTVSTTQNSEI